MAISTYGQFHQSKLSQFKNHTDSLIELSNEEYYSGNFETALVYLTEALRFAKITNNQYDQALIMKSIGGVLETQGKYNESAAILMKSLQIAEKNQFKNLQSSIHLNMGILFFNLRRGEDALAQYRKSLFIAGEIKDSLLIVKAFNNIGNTYMSIFSDIVNAEKYFILTLEMSEKISFLEGQIVGLNNLTQIYLNSNRLDLAENSIIQAMNTDSLSPYSYFNVANYYKITQQPKKSIQFFHKALDLCEAELELQQVLLKDLSDVYAETGDFKNALQNFQLYNENKEKLHKMETQKFILDLQAKYENDKKEQEIEFLSLQRKKTKKTIAMLTTGAVTLALLLVFILLYLRNQRIIGRQKALLHENELKRLEHEQLLIAASAGLKGEEKERIRLARDLHDGIGGLLSGLKLTLSGIKFDDNSADKLNMAIHLINESNDEVKRIARNIMPETLTQRGLKDAIEQFCSTLNNHMEATELGFHFFGEQKRFASSFELSVYRSVQELVNNAAKYSKAQRIDVQLMQEDERLFVSVCDNGIGFLVEPQLFVQGKGLDNIQYRCEAFGGRFEIHSNPGDGTECIIEFTHLTKNKAIYDRSIDC